MRDTLEVAFDVHVHHVYEPALQQFIHAPQGGVISPLLANISLNPLDWQMVREGCQMVRYADDIIILCADAESAARVLQSLREWMAEAGLTLHPEKTKLGDMGEPKAHFDVARFCFRGKVAGCLPESALGYRFWRGKTSGRVKRFIRPKSVQKFREAIKPLTKRKNGHSLETIAQRLKPKLRGFYG